MRKTHKLLDKLIMPRSVQMHDLIIGLFINRFEFGLAV
jgi:hypothetical protein